MLKDNQDAFGHAMQDYLKGNARAEIAEREDGFISPTGGPEAYFTEYRFWHPVEKTAMRYVRGRVLDIGCGAGRHSLYLQGKGFDVLGIDNSPLAIEVSKQRGLKNVAVMSLAQINSKIGIFDTILMLGGNFGLFGSPDRAKRLLSKFARITSAGARIITATRDTYDTDNPDHLDYHEFNRQRGRMSGQLRLRVRYRKYATPWMDYLLVSREEMQGILNGTPWNIKKFIDSDSDPYVAIIEKRHP